MSARRAPSRARRAAVATLIGALAALAVIGCGGGGGDSSDSNAGSVSPGGASTPASTSRDHPNLLLVMTDDQDTTSFTDEVMPRTRRFFANGGTEFSQAITAPPLCCPSRSGVLSGEYTQNSGVLSNEPGYKDFKRKHNTLPVWLQGAGYRTGLVGKFLGEYEASAGAAPAPGFDRWFALYGFAGYYGTEVSDQGVRKTLPSDDYTTDELTKQAVDFATKDPKQPFFLWLAYNAPHTVPNGTGVCKGTAAQPREPTDLDRYAKTQPARGPAYDEKDISDKPSWIQKPPMSARKVAINERIYRCQLASLGPVDQGLGKVIDALKRSGQLDDTVVIFISDNGYLFGEHRLTADKRFPYEPSIRVPMAAWVPPALRGDYSPSSLDELVSQVDITPTLLDYASAKPCDPEGKCRRIDSRSLRPLLEGDDSGWPTDRAIPFQLDDNYAYSAVRTPDWAYWEQTADYQGTFPKPVPELYDLRNDPDELQNLAGDPSAASEQARMAKLLKEQSRCSGLEGRDDPRPGRPFCQ